MTVTQEELILRAQSGDRQAGEQLVVENSGLIWSIARRYFGRGVDPDDLYQLGCVGFLKAIAGFDVQYGTQFSTYAVPMIIGELKRVMRANNGLRVPRSVRDTAYRVLQTRSEIEAEKADRTISGKFFMCLKSASLCLNPTLPASTSSSRLEFTYLPLPLS